MNSRRSSQNRPLRALAVISSTFLSSVALGCGEGPSLAGTVLERTPVASSPEAVSSVNQISSPPPETRKLNRQARLLATDLGGRVISLYRDAKTHPDKNHRSFRTNPDRFSYPRYTGIYVAINSGKSEVPGFNGIYKIHADFKVGKDKKLGPEELMKVDIEAGSPTTVETRARALTGLAHTTLGAVPGQNAWGFRGSYAQIGAESYNTLGITSPTPNNFPLNGEQLGTAGTQMQEMLDDAGSQQPTVYRAPPF